LASSLRAGRTDPCSLGTVWIARMRPPTRPSQSSPEAT
jgi:hypothetical protein